MEAVQADITQQWNVNTISMTNCTHLQVQQITTFLLALLFYQSIPFTPLLHLPAPPLPPRLPFLASPFPQSLLRTLDGVHGKKQKHNQVIGLWSTHGSVNLWGCSTV